MANFILYFRRDVFFLREGCAPVTHDIDQTPDKQRVGVVGVVLDQQEDEEEGADSV